MLDIAKDEEEAKSFIVGLDVVDGNIVVKYASGREETMSYSLHNLNFYRILVERQSKDNIDHALNNLAKDSFMVYVKRVVTIVAGIIGSIIVFNIDIHIIMKIIIVLLMLLGEAFYYFYNEIYLNILDDDLREMVALEYYLKNIDIFKYYDTKIGENGYVLPIEDISKYNLSIHELEQISAAVKKFREEGYENNEIVLSYTKPNE